MNRKTIIGWLTLTMMLVALVACGAQEDDGALEDTSVGDAGTGDTTTDEEAMGSTGDDSASDIDDMSAHPDAASGTERGEDGGPIGPGLGPKGQSTRTGDSGWVDEVVSPDDVLRDGEFGEIVMAEGAAPPAEPFSDERDSVAQASLLNAGEIDDNAQWDEYLLYRLAYEADNVIDVDITERHQIVVLDADDRPVLGARISIRANAEEVLVLRTHSDGRANFFPGTLPAAQKSDMYTVDVEGAAGLAQLQIPAGQSATWSVALPVTQPAAESANLDVLFLIDATGSMGDEIAQLKANIFVIATRVGALPSQPDVRFGMVVYRDRGDAYVARTFDFTPDVDAFAVALDEIQAEGGGDYPEDLNTALNRAVHVPEWRIEDTVSLIFLVADAPPHLDYEDQETSYAVEMVAAAARGIKIFPIASSGLDPQGEYIFRQLAQFTGGRFIFLTYGTGGPGTTGDETSFEVEDYTVNALDDLVVATIEAELAFLGD